MSQSKLNKYNIKLIRDCSDGLYIVSNDGDEWILRTDNILLHSNARGRGNIEYHRQCEVNGLHHCLGYIRSHSRRYTYKPRVSKMERLFAMI